MTPQFEVERWNSGHLVIGVDEAGRGALAGPVVAAAVVFRMHDIPDGMDDSKKLTAPQRSEAALRIREHALAWAVGMVHHDRIDEVNILQATFDAMHAAIDDVASKLEAAQNAVILVDGNRFRQHRLSSETIIGGDGICPSIAAASILAKTVRDAWMMDIDARYPGYGFAKHKGYATIVHRTAVRTLGPCEIHRHTFLRSILAQPALPFDNA